MLITTQGTSGTYQTAPHLRAHGKAWVGWADDSGHHWVTEVDETTGDAKTVLVGTTGANRHKNPAFEILPDGRLVVFYGNHGTTIRMRISTSPNTVTDGFASDVSVPTGDNTPYPQPIVTEEGSGTERIYLFYARSASGRQARYLYTDNRGSSWTSPQTIFENGSEWVYPAARRSKATGRILVAMTDSNPDHNTFETSGYLMILDGGVWKNAAGDTLSLPQTPSAATQFYDAAEHDHHRIQWLTYAYEDEGGNIYALHRGKNHATNAMQYFRCVWNGSSWNVQGVLSPSDISAGIEAIGNSPLINDGEFDTIYGQLRDGGSRDMFRFTTSDDGSTWQRENITNGSIEPVDPAHTIWNTVEVKGGATGSPAWVLTIWRMVSESTFDGAVWLSPFKEVPGPDPGLVLRPEPESLVLYPEGHLNGTPQPEAPSAAPSVTLTPASQTALSLSLSEVDGATGYRYRVGTSGSWTDLGSDRTAQITSLSPGTSYTVQARAYNSAGDGPIGSATASTLEPEGEVAIQLAATATVTTSASAGLRRRVQPVGITEATSGVSGALTRRVRLHSRAAAYTGANGAILRSVRVVGSARAASAAHATLSVGEPLPHPTTLGVTIEDIYTLAAIIED